MRQVRRALSIKSRVSLFALSLPLLHCGQNRFPHPPFFHHNKMSEGRRRITQQKKRKKKHYTEGRKGEIAFTLLAFSFSSRGGRRPILLFLLLLRGSQLCCCSEAIK